MLKQVAGRRARFYDLDGRQIHTLWEPPRHFENLMGFRRNEFPDAG